MAITRLEIPSVDTLRNSYCNDIRRMKVKAGVANPNVAPGSETYIRGEAISSVAIDIIAKNAALQDATMPDSAVGEDLLRWGRVNRGIEPSAGAGAQGNVVVTTTGPTVFAQGTECRSKSGVRYQVVTSTAASNGDSVPVAGVDVGVRTNQIEGTELTWTAPPSASAMTCKVGTGGLTNGIDADNDARYRRRVQDAIRHPAASGSWAHYAQWAEQNASVEKAFVYPAINGPATVSVAISCTPTEDNNYSRQASAALVAQVAMNIVNNDPEYADVTTASVVDYPTNTTILMTIPLPIEDGGTGGGWIDGASTHWPQYTTGAVALTAAPISTKVFRCDVLNISNIPIVNANFAIWSSTARKFLHAKVKSVTLIAATTYEITTYAPLDTSLIVSGDYISPDAEKLDDYAATIRQQFAALGPGEGTSAVAKLPRSLRHPAVKEDWPSSLTSVNIGQLSVAHPEITHVALRAPTLPATPAVAWPPYTLNIGKLALYKY